VRPPLTLSSRAGSEAQANHSSRKQVIHLSDGSGAESQRVRFEFTHPTAESVFIAGTFNDWHPQTTRMIALGDGRWAKDLALPPGHYEYCLVVDGQWIPDPRAAETAHNPFGGISSIRRVTHARAARRSSAPKVGKQNPNPKPEHVMES
jgi:1,4-alpha-glucan branching enzyme